MLGIPWAWRASAARSTVRTLPTTRLWTRVGAGLIVGHATLTYSGPEERVGAVREPTHSHGDPLFSMNVVSRDRDEVSREIMEGAGSGQPDSALGLAKPLERTEEDVIEDNEGVP